LHLFLGPVAPAWVASRTSSIALLTVFALYPMSRLENLAPLAKFSIIGTFGTVFTAFFVALRYFQGAYLPGGAFRGPLGVGPLLQGAPAGLGPDALILASMLSTAYMAHVNAPRMYRELRAPAGDASSAGKLRLFGQVVFAAFAIVIALSTLVMACGFLTFGGATQGNILDNYSTADPLALIARVAVTVSVLFGHPLQFVGYRDGMKQILPRFPPGTSVALLAAATLVAICMRDLGLLQAFKGALVSVFLIFVAPPCMAAARAKAGGRLGFGAIAALGLLLGAAGLHVTLAK